MNIKLNDFGTGWYSAELGLTAREIEQFISMLEALKKKKFDHFVVVSNSESEKGGLENIEIYLTDENQDSNAALLGGDISPS